MATSHLIATAKAVTPLQVVTGDIEIAESQRSHIGDTEGFIGTQKRGDSENIIKFSEDTEGF